MAEELKDQRIPIMMSPSEVKAIDDWMFANRMKSRAQAIRRLCQFAILAEPEATKLFNALQNFTKSVSPNSVALRKFLELKSLNEKQKRDMGLALVKVVLGSLSEMASPIARLAVVEGIAKAPREESEELGFEFQQALERLFEVIVKVDD